MKSWVFKKKIEKKLIAMQTRIMKQENRFRVYQVLLVIGKEACGAKNRYRSCIYEKGPSIELQC